MGGRMVVSYVSLPDSPGNRGGKNKDCSESVEVGGACERQGRSGSVLHFQP
jgi:hypothetical protein